MKKTMCFLVIFGLISSFSSFALDNAEGLDIWFKAGQHKGDVSFQESYFNSTRSELDFEMDGLYFIGMGVRYQFLQNEDAWNRLSIALEGYTAGDLDGSVKDYDYLSSSNDILIYSSSDGEGETNQFDVNLGWQLGSTPSGNAKVGLLFGYYYQSYDIDIINVNTLIWNYQSINDVALGHASEYQTRFTGNYLGVDGSLSLFNDKLKFSGSLKFLPNLRGDAEGKWQARALEFEQSAEGEGFIIDAGVTFKPAKNWAIGLSLVQTSLEVKNGHSDNLYYEQSTDVYGNNGLLGGIPDYEYIQQTDVDYIKIKNFRTEFKVSYQFD